MTVSCNSVPGWQADYYAITVLHSSTSKKVIILFSLTLPNTCGWKLYNVHWHLSIPHFFRQEPFPTFGERRIQRRPTTSVPSHVNKFAVVSINRSVYETCCQLASLYPCSSSPACCVVEIRLKPSRTFQEIDSYRRLNNRVTRLNLYYGLFTIVPFKCYSSRCIERKTLPLKETVKIKPCRVARRRRRRRQTIFVTLNRQPCFLVLSCTCTCQFKHIWMTLSRCAVIL